MLQLQPYFNKERGKKNVVDVREIGLPTKFKSFRPGQSETIDHIIKYFSIEPDRSDMFLLDGPCGTGKSIIGVSVALILNREKEVIDRLSDNGDMKPRCIYVTNTKQLQDQLLKDFPMAKGIKGRRNYPCALRPDKFPLLSAEDCYLGSACSKKESCEYYKAKMTALRAPISVLNYSYFLTEANAYGMFSGAHTLIFDEVDTLESAVMNYIQFTVSSNQIKKFKLPAPQDDTWLGWVDWTKVASEIIEREKAMVQAQLPFSCESWSDSTVSLHKEFNSLDNFSKKLSQFRIMVNPRTWVFSSRENESGDKIWTFKPVFINEYSRFYFRHGHKILGMSGTILDPKIMASNLGIVNYDYAKLASPFPKENRPIHFVPAANIIRKEMEQELPKLEKAIIKILAMYPNDKILIHTTSYPIRDYLQYRLDLNRVITHNSNDREDKLQEFKTSKKPLVMLSPSFDRGVDLPEDLCRVIIIAKVPYIDMGDQQVRARMEAPDGDKWYLMHTAQTLLQMTGRGVRSETDYCTTFILDAQFKKLFRRVHWLFPKWWTDAFKDKVEIR